MRQVTSRFSKEADKLKPPPAAQTSSSTDNYVLQSPYFDQDSADSGTYDSCISGGGRGSGRGGRRSNRGRGGKRLDNFYLFPKREKYAMLFLNFFY